MEKRMPLLPMSTRACRWVAACFKGDVEAIFAMFFLVIVFPVSMFSIFDLLVTSFVLKLPRMSLEPFLSFDITGDR